MAIVKASGRVSRMEGDFSPEIISGDESDDEDEISNSSDSGDESDSSDADSGMGSDEFDLSELGEANTEFCQVGKQSFSVPLELYDLPDLTSVLSLETWNECLTEEERFSLAEFLPDMDLEILGPTLNELFTGKNFHFGSPIHDLFNKLKGGMLDPRIVLYRRGLNSIKVREHYYLLRQYQNSMVGGFLKIGDAWQNCSGYGVGERLRLWNILRSQRSLVYEREGDVNSDTDLENSDERLFDGRYKIGHRADPTKFVKDNAKGILKVTPPKASIKKEYLDVPRYPSSVKHGFEKKSKASKGLVGLPQKDHDQRFDSRSSQRARDEMRVSINDDRYEDEDVLKEQHLEMGNRNRLLMQGKKKAPLRQNARGVTDSGFGYGESKGYTSQPPHNSKSRVSEQGVTIASYNPHSLETMSNAKYPAKDWMYPTKDQVHHLGLKGAQADWSAGVKPYRHGKLHKEPISSDYQVKGEEQNVQNKKRRAEVDFSGGRSRTGLDSSVRSYKNSPAHIGDSYAKSLQGKYKGRSGYNDGSGIEYSRDGSTFSQSDETESDSSEQMVMEDEDTSPYVSNFRYPAGAAEVPQQGHARTSYDSKKSSKLNKADLKLHSGIRSQEMETYSTKAKQKSKGSDPNYMEDIILVKKSQVPHNSGNSQPQWQKSYTADKKRKRAVDLAHSLEPNYLRDYGSGILDDNAEYFDERSQYLDSRIPSNTSGNKYQVTDALTTEADPHGRSNMPLLGCNTVAKKRKGNADIMNQDEIEESVYLQSSPMQQTDEPSFIKKKGKKKVDAAINPVSVVTSDIMVPEKETTDVQEPKPQKKPFTLITPSKHTGFSFSIIHLLSAIRKAMITPHLEDTADLGDCLDKCDGTLRPKGEENTELHAVNDTQTPNSDGNMDVNAPDSAVQNNLRSLTVQEIVNRVRTNPGDPCILETQEPLQDLVRGVLKIFSSKTAPLGAKAWKALVAYEKSNKSWYWVGPVSSSPHDTDIVEEETSPEAWGLPHKTIVKLVDSFANWLKSGQETLKQIGSLPPPPVVMLPQLDEKERFRDLRAQKSLNTISPSSEEVREYFRKEEQLRYSIPDRAFSYTAADGKKSIVAPLRRGGGKPTSKARDHIMLKTDRPPHVTILCLVRDAAARLPGGIGTRADVCTLIRDSQYVVEDVPDEKVNQVVSGALDRLHYERDPCVQFDGDRKLWVYLHRDRVEEDFEDDGTSSTKKWKRPRKDQSETPDTGAANDSTCPGTGDIAADDSGRYDLNPDLNADLSSVQAGTEDGLVYNDLRPNMENIQSYVQPSSADRGQGNTISWEPIGLNPLHENKMMCQENSTNEDFDDEAFSRPVGLLSASLL